MKETRKNNLKVGLATLILVRRTHGAGMETARVDGLSEKCVSRMICSLRHPPQELLEVAGPALLNLSAGSQTIAAQHEANDHA